MNKVFPILLVLLAVVAGSLLFVRKRTALPPAGAPPTFTVQPQQAWTPEQIAKDPEGYLAWSDRQVQAQITAREERLAAIAARRGDVEARQKELESKIQAAENFRRRLATAYDRAVDEDRWPVRMAGRTFERAKARGILEEIDVWLEDRRPLADAYTTSLAKMDDSAAAMRTDLRSLGRLREKIALDIERVRLNEGNAELEQLRKTEGELASLSNALGQMSDEQAPVLPSSGKSAHVDIDSILK